MKHWTAIFTDQSNYKKQARLAAILWTLLIFIACLWPGKELPHSNIPLIDKWVHFIIFGGFSFLWLCAYPGINFKNLFIVFAAGCVLGYLVEVLQGTFPELGRSMDMMDAVADGIGSLLGTLFFRLLAGVGIRKS